MGNLKNPPLFLRPSVVRALIGDVQTIAKGMALLEVRGTVNAESGLPELARTLGLDAPEITRFDTTLREPANDLPEVTSPHAHGGEHEPEPVPVTAPVGSPSAPVPLRQAQGQPDGDRPDLAKRNAAMAAAYAEGHDLRSLGKRFGISKTSVKTGILAAGGVLRPRSQRSPLFRKCAGIEERNAAIAAAYAANDPMPALVERFGLSANSIYQIVSQTGAKRPPREPKPRAPKVPKVKKVSAAVAEARGRAAAIAAAYSEGADGVVLAAEYGISPSRVYQIARKHGVARGRGSAGARNGRTSPGTGLHVAPRPVAQDPAPLPVKTKAQEKAEVGRAIHRQQTIKGQAEAAARREARVARQAERAAKEDAVFDQFTAALARVKARREGKAEVVAKPAPAKTDWAKIAALHAAKATPKRESAAPARPLEPAPSREECPRCGVPGWKGCAHFLPCELGAPARLADPEEQPERGDRRRFTGLRQGKSVLPV